jgi:hypothetical protein
VHSVTLDWLVVVTRPLQAALAWRLSMFCFGAAAHCKPCPRVQVAHNTKACSHRSYFCARNHFCNFLVQGSTDSRTAALVPTFTNTNVQTTRMEIHSKSDTHDIVARLPSTSNLPMHRTRPKISQHFLLRPIFIHFIFLARFFLLCFRLLAVMDVEAHTPCSVLFAFQLRTSISGRHVRTCSCRGAPTVTQSDSNL